MVLSSFDSQPQTILGLWSSISWLNSACVLLFTKLLQFTTINLMLLCVFCSFGGSSSNLLEVVFMVDSNTLSSSSLLSSSVKLLYGLLISISLSFIDVVLRFIDPQGGHVHVKLLIDCNLLYSVGVVFPHLMWIQSSQSSHWIALWLLATVRLHIPHGHFDGPGLISISPDRSSIVQMHGCIFLVLHLCLFDVT